MKKNKERQEKTTPDALILVTSLYLAKSLLFIYVTGSYLQNLYL